MSLQSLVVLVTVYAVMVVMTHARVLSVRASDEASAALRVQKLTEISSQIKNIPRGLVVNNVTFPLYMGPNQSEGTMAYKIQMQELAKLRNFGIPTTDKVAALAAQWAKTLTSPEDVVSFYQEVLETNDVAALAESCATKFTTIQDFTTFYDRIALDLEKPWSTNNSDEAYGAQRLVFKGFTLQLVNENFPRHLTIQDDQLAQHCGAGLTTDNIRAKKALFVSNYDNVYQFNDPAKVDVKYVPNVVGFFCFNNDTQHLLPVEIFFPDTGIAYTPFDTEDEWTLAKMALEATEIDFQNMQHMAETHAMTISMRVEAYRSLHEDHPVYELFTHHVFADFALELLSERLLLNTSTEVDMTFGFGATGALRFLGDRLTNDAQFVSVANDFPTDVQRRGLDNIPTHKYVQYGRLYYAAFDEFVKGVLDVHYPTEDELLNDHEVQNWAAGCSVIPHLRDFPEKFESKAQLRKLLVHIIFQSTFKHHAMNGVVSWHGVSMPYSIPAVWHPLPTQKLQPGEHLDLMKYTIPKELVGHQVRSPAAFYRAIPLSETLLDAYRETPFAEDPRLFNTTRTYENALRAIDLQLAETEAGAPQAWPYHLYRPSKLPYYTWI